MTNTEKIRLLECRIIRHRRVIDKMRHHQSAILNIMTPAITSLENDIICWEREKLSLVPADLLNELPICVKL